MSFASSSFRLAVAALVLGSVGCHRSSSSAGPGDDVAEGQAIFKQRCALCHPIGQTSAQAPGLGGVVGRKAASLRGFTYTPALKASGITWDAHTLDTFLTMPSAMVKGTTMPLAVPDPKDRTRLIAYLATLSTTALASSTASASSDYVSGAAFGDWHRDAPGTKHEIKVADLPAPFASPSSANRPVVVPRPANASPQLPAGYSAHVFASGLENPRQIRVAPNGDIFVAETAENRVRVLRAKDGANEAETKSIFAADLDQPFGIAFWPPGPSPKYVYVANMNSVVRFAYANGDLKAKAAPETIVAKIAPTSGGHTTRDVAFSADGSRLLVSVGSSNNVGEEMTPDPIAAAATEKARGLGAAWGADENRADVLSFTPEGKDPKTFANGIRNCVTLLAHGSDVWCATNERDGLGDDLVPDYVTRVKEGAFYGWPWYYLGDHEDPRHAGERKDLVGKITVPDVLFQPHSAPL
ncbi:MAG TPA: c-type cytochrome, partial [Polyangiaceae bacterium]